MRGKAVSDKVLSGLSSGGSWWVFPDTEVGAAGSADREGLSYASIRNASLWAIGCVLTTHALCKAERGH